MIPSSRISLAADLPVRTEGDFVLYWMIANRRSRWNFALQRAVAWGKKLNKPLLVLEPLRLDYPWASERIHRFIIEGMADNADAFRKSPILYYPYIEPEGTAGRGLLAALSERAAVIVADEFPCFMLPRMVDAASRQVSARMETIDSNGLLPLRAADERVFSSAYSFRRFLQKTLPDHLGEMPKADPLRGVKLPVLKRIPDSLTRRWPVAALKDGAQALVSTLRFKNDVPAVETCGGSSAAARVLKRFISSRLGRYDDGRTDLDDTSTSGLSPYLHFGHISAHEVFSVVARESYWTPGKLGKKAHGKRSGWWGMDSPTEAFLDQLVTWRELGFNMTFHRNDYGRYESLPFWAQETLRDHEKDERPYLYTLSEFGNAATHDPLWNAAQRQLLSEGAMHNYLRMLWGKKILEWSRTPQEALATMIELNNKYALDGRNPNSYSGIFWVLGRYDRPWGPERPIFGKIRYMSSDNTARKMRVKGYLEKYGSTKDGSSK